MGREDGIMGVTAWTRKKAPKVVADTYVLVQNLKSMSLGMTNSLVCLELGPKGSVNSSIRMMVPKSAIPLIERVGLSVRVLDPSAVSKPLGAKASVAREPLEPVTTDLEKKTQEALKDASRGTFQGPPVLPPQALPPPAEAPAKPGGQETVVPGGDLPEPVRVLAQRTRGELMKECSQLKINWQGNRVTLAWRLARHHGLVK